MATVKYVPASSRRGTSNTITTRNVLSVDRVRWQTAWFYVRAAIANLQAAECALSPNQTGKETGIWDWGNVLEESSPSAAKVNGKRKSRGK